MSKDLEFAVEDWGEIPYQEAFQKQESYVKEISLGERPETLVFCTHPPVVTLGRGTREGDVFSWNGEIVEVNRGGRATYHGPSQIVFYPLIYLGEINDQFLDKKIKPKDLHEYFRTLEESMINVLREYKIEGEGHSLQKQVGEAEAQESTGVWVNDQKISSIGIAVKKWITMHGAALNVYEDSRAFQGMNPCGFKSYKMTSVETLVGKTVDRSEFTKKWLEAFLNLIV